MWDLIMMLASDHPRDFATVLLLLSLMALVSISITCITVASLYEARCRHIERLARIVRGDDPGPDKPPASPGWEDKEDG